MPIEDFPVDVPDTAPTFLVGGNSALNGGLGGPSRAVTGPAGLALVAAADAAAGRAVLQLGSAAVADAAAFDAAGAAAAVTLSTLSLGVNSAEGVDRQLLDSDNGKNLICTGALVFTLNAGMVAGFGCAFDGTVSFVGTASVTDIRTVGAANPWCYLAEVGMDTYKVIGGKA